MSNKTAKTLWSTIYGASEGDLKKMDEEFERDAVIRDYEDLSAKVQKQVIQADRAIQEEYRKLGKMNVETVMKLSQEIIAHKNNLKALASSYKALFGNDLKNLKIDL